MALPVGIGHRLQHALVQLVTALGGDTLIAVSRSTAAELVDIQWGRGIAGEDPRDSRGAVGLLGGSHEISLMLRCACAGVNDFGLMLQADHERVLPFACRRHSPYASEVVREQPCVLIWLHPRAQPAALA